MKFVQPIRSLKQVSQIKNILLGEGNIRDLLLFELGINSALRASDLLRVTVGDVYNGEGHIHEYFEMKEKKTGKRSRITITPKVRGTLELFRTTYPNVVQNPENFLFFAKKTFPLGSTNIGRVRMWKIVNRLTGSIGLQGSFGCHTTRKTWATLARLQSVDISLIQAKLNHSSLVVTRRYLSITDDELTDACNKLDL